MKVDLIRKRKTTRLVWFLVVLAIYSCQKELPVPPSATTNPAVSVPTYIKAKNDTFTIRAFYGHQGITPPSVGTVIFPLAAYNVAAPHELKFMSAYTGLNGYGDSANTVKKNLLNDYNGEFYNLDVNAKGNAWITITPVNRPTPDNSSVSTQGDLAYDKFFTQAKQVIISVQLVKGIWERCDTATNGKITVYQMDKMYLQATESVETGLATRNGVQKLKNGQSETYLTFVNQNGYIINPPKDSDRKPSIWRPHLLK